MNRSDCWYNSVCNVDNCSGCIRYEEMSSLMNYSNIPKAKQLPVKMIPQDCDYDAFCSLADIKDDVAQFVEQGKNLYITSNITGNGKTTWAVKIMLKYFDCVWAGNGFKPRGLFVHVPTFLLKCKEFDKVDSDFDQLKSLLPSVDLVIWDDVASNELSSYDCSQLLQYIDLRNSELKSNIYTGNFSPDIMMKTLGAKLTSRIINKNTTVITLKGADRR